MWLAVFSLQHCFFGKLLIESSQFDRLSWLPRAFYHLHCLSCKSLVLSCSGSGNCTLSEFDTDVNHIFSLKPWLSQGTCSPAVRPPLVTPLKESMNFLNLVSLEMSSCSLLSRFHLWDPLIWGFCLLYKDRAKGEGDVTQTSFCSKQKQRVACLAVDRVCVSVNRGFSLCLYVEVQPCCRSVLFGDWACS